MSENGVMDAKEAKKQIKKNIEARGFKGQLSANMVLRFPKDEIEVLVMEGLSDKKIADICKIGMATANVLRRFYELPTTKEVKERLAAEGKNEVAQVDTDEADELMVGEAEEAKETEAAEMLTKQEDIMRELDREKDEEVLKLGIDDDGRVVDGINEEMLATLEPMALEPVLGKPILDVETTGKLAAPLVNGVAKHLDRMEDVGKVRVIVVVEAL